jgi:hypothetical protein
LAAIRLRADEFAWPQQNARRAKSRHAVTADITSIRCKKPMRPGGDHGPDQDSIPHHKDGPGLNRCPLRLTALLKQKSSDHVPIKKHPATKTPG